MAHFEAIEDVPVPGGNDLEGEVVVVAADFTSWHGNLLVEPTRVKTSYFGGRPLAVT
jgi:hypothetical protein